MPINLNNTPDSNAGTCGSESELSDDLSGTYIERQNFVMQTTENLTLHDLVIQINKMSNKMNKMEEKNEKMEKTNKRIEQENKRIVQENKRIAQENKRLEQECKKILENNERLYSRLAELESQNYELYKKVKSSEEGKITFLQAIEQYKAEAEIMKQQLKDKNKEADELRKIKNQGIWEDLKFFLSKRFSKPEDEQTSRPSGRSENQQMPHA